MLCWKDSVKGSEGDEVGFMVAVEVAKIKTEACKDWELSACKDETKFSLNTS